MEKRINSEAQADFNYEINNREMLVAQSILDQKNIVLHISYWKAMSCIASLFYHALDQAGNYLQSFTHNHVCLWHPRSGRRLLIKAMNGIRNIAGGGLEGIKAAGLKITRKENMSKMCKHKKKWTKWLGVRGVGTAWTELTWTHFFCDPLISPSNQLAPVSCSPLSFSAYFTYAGSP